MKFPSEFGLEAHTSGTRMQTYNGGRYAQAWKEFKF